MSLPEGGAADRNPGKRIRALRCAAGLTLEAVSQRSGFSVSHLSNAERGVRSVTPSVSRAYEELADSVLRDVPQKRGDAADGQRGQSGAQPPDFPGSHRDDFGTRLMRLRLERGWSLRQVARMSKISYQHLGNLETGRRQPTETIAEACDRALVGDGSLNQLAGAHREASEPAFTDWHVPRGLSTPPMPDLDVRTLSREFLRLRSEAQSERAGRMFPLVAGTAEVLAGQAVAQGEHTRRAWVLAARYAELAGWMAQEGGREDCSDAWTDAAVRWAKLGGDDDMAAYAWERRSLAPFCRGEARTAIALAQRAIDEPTASARIRGLAACRVAQSHSMTGDRNACLRSLDQAASMLDASPPPYPDGTSWGSSSMRGVLCFVEAWCLVDLGRYQQAEYLLGPIMESDALPAGAFRTRSRYAVRTAMALTGAGDIDQARKVILGLLPLLARAESATVAADLRNLIKLINRRRAAPLLRLLPDLHNFSAAAH